MAILRVGTPEKLSRGGGHSEFSWVSMCVRHMWKTTLIVWSLSWIFILLFEWLTVKNTLFGTILVKILWKRYHFLHFCRFRYHNWVIGDTQPLKNILFHSDFRTNMLTHASTESPTPPPRTHPTPPHPTPHPTVTQDVTASFISDEMIRNWSFDSEMVSERRLMLWNPETEPKALWKKTNMHVAKQ